MSENEPTRAIEALDHTDIKQRAKRMWTFNEIRLPGVYLPSLGVGFVVGLVTFTVAILLGLLLGAVWIQAIGFLLAVVFAVITGMGWEKFRPDSMKPGHWLLLDFDWRWRQPRTFNGYGEDTEPTHVTWQVILWEPDRRS